MGGKGKGGIALGTNPRGNREPAGGRSQVTTADGDGLDCGLSGVQGIEDGDWAGRRKRGRERSTESLLR